ncbi:hypothetical protein [Pseudomarimonas arenosa]|uniref:Signal transduction histidine kinase n=1 Tax=Pseudomarimonas arenosa TaxID=2774145 RepID=A0AAW3ZIV0_9GAMM|nr:hypothetical protein [Pseudomarimonas arenosa]MBD8526008.1 hypothetical protein [Pseudomarimonas arenosa]
MLEWLAFALVLTGLAVVVSVQVLRVEARRYVRRAAELIALREQAGVDALLWFELAKPVLQRMPIIGLRYRGEWYGSQVHGGWGDQQGERRQRRLQVGDMQLDIDWHLQPSRGERRPMREGVLAVFELLVEQSMMGKAQAVSAALAQQAELSLYLQHDVKNLAQWVLLATDQLLEADPSNLAEVAGLLRSSAEIARRKAEGLAKQLSDRQTPEPLLRELDLLSEAQIYAGFHGFHLELPSNGPRFRLAKLAVERCLDGLFAHLANWATGADIRVRLRPEAQGVCVSICVARLPPITIERLFEPLLSDAAGGMALFQARLAAQAAGGELIAALESNGIEYRLCLPLPSATSANEA